MTEELERKLVEAVLDDWKASHEERQELTISARILVRKAVERFGESDARAWLRFRTVV